MTFPLVQLEANPNWQLVQRIAGSRYFRKSQKMREFLLYVCEKSLTECTDEIREQQIGASVFGRKPDYNPSEDSIVRTEAWEMRRRLEKFFQDEGREEPVILTIPKGSYLPVFKTREEAALEGSGNGAASNGLASTGGEPGTSPSPAEDGYRDSALPHKTSNMWPVLLILLLMPLVWLGWDDYRQRAVVSQYSAYPAFPAGGIWGNLFDDRHDTVVVMGDSSLVSYQRLARKEVRLDDYATLRYLTQIDSLDLKWIAEYPLVSSTAASIAARIVQRNRAPAQRARIRFARDMKVQDFKQNHAILIGSRLSVRWIDLYDDRLNFYFDFASSVKPEMDMPAFVNRKPGRGEAEVYTRRQLNVDFVESYAVVAYLPNLDATGNVLIIAGLTPADCDGATDLLLRPDFPALLPAELDPARNGGRWTHFELLLKTNYFQSLTKNVNLVTYRVLPARSS